MVEHVYRSSHVECVCSRSCVSVCLCECVCLCVATLMNNLLIWVKIINWWSKIMAITFRTRSPRMRYLHVFRWFLITLEYFDRVRRFMWYLPIEIFILIIIFLRRVLCGTERSRATTTTFSVRKLIFMWHLAFGDICAKKHYLWLI